jgi:hypothetical protein
MRLLLFLALFGGSITPAYTQTLFCRLPGIAGQEGASKRAKEYLPGNTSDVRKMAVYLSIADPEPPSILNQPKPFTAEELQGLTNQFKSGKSAGKFDFERFQQRLDPDAHVKLYAHSNFVSDGAKNPTKMLSPEKIEYFAALLRSLISDDDFKKAKLNIDDPDNLHLPITLYVDQGVFLNHKYKNLDFTGFDKIFVIGRDGKAREAARLEADSRRLAVRYYNSLFARPEVEDAARVFGRLKEEPFSKDKVKVMVFVDNTDTQAAAQRIPSENRINVNLRSDSDWRNQFANHPNTTMIVLGHVEDASIVVLDSGQNETLRISLADMVLAANSHKISLIALGCNTAGFGSVFTGVDSKFNTVDAANRISQALNAKSKLDFLDLLAPKSQGLKLVVDKQVLRDGERRMQLTIFDVSKGAAAFVVGAVIFTGISTALGDPISEDFEYTKPAIGVGAGACVLMWWWRRRRRRSILYGTAI